MATDSLTSSGWTNNDMIQELSDIMEHFDGTMIRGFGNGNNLEEALNFDKEALDSAMSSASFIYLSSKDKETKANAFRVAELLEFLKNGFCGYARYLIDEAIDENTDEMNIAFAQEFKDYFKNKFTDLGFSELRTQQTFDSRQGNVVYSHDLMVTAYSSDECQKGVPFLILAQSFYNSAFDYMDAMVSASEAGLYSSVEEYLDMLLEEEVKNWLPDLLERGKLKLDFLNPNPDIIKLFG